MSAWNGPFIGGSNGSALFKLVERVLNDVAVRINPPSKNTDPYLFVFTRTGKDGHEQRCEIEAWSLGTLIDALESEERKLSSQIMDTYVRRSRGEWDLGCDLNMIADAYVFAHELRCSLQHVYSAIKFELERRVEKELTAIENEYSSKSNKLNTQGE